MKEKLPSHKGKNANPLSTETRKIPTSSSKELNNEISGVNQNPKSQSAPTDTSETDQNKILENAETGVTLNNPTQNNKLSLFSRFASIIKVIKIELLVGLLALTLSLGQYFQSGVAIRINITSTWRDGYTSETRNRVAKFRYLYPKWRSKCGENDEQCKNKVDDTVRKLASTKRLFSEKISEDENITELISDEINSIKANKREPTDEDYIEAALKYRNALIECLNTAEAVKAVIESRPLPFRKHLLYSDTLEGRYRDIIEELRNDLTIFIVSYREATPKRETKAWYVLDSEESNKNDYFVFVTLILILVISLTVIYFLKRQFRFSESRKEEVK